MFSRDICDPCLLWTWVCSEAFKPELSCWQMLLLNLDAYLGAGQYMLLCFCSSHGSFSFISSSIPFLPFLFPFPFLSWDHLSPHLSFYSPGTQATVHFTPLGSHDFSVLRAVWQVFVYTFWNGGCRDLSCPGVPGWAVMKQRPQLFLGQQWVLSWCWACVVGRQINVSRGMPFWTLGTT